MRIDSNPGAQSLLESQAANSAAAKANAAATAASALGEDQAQLSGVHVQVQALVAQALHLPEISQEKIQALRDVVLAGKYQPNPEDVAGALLSEMVTAVAA
jgi:flagellar biosynthesis anti-sigma factor FlgM